jgi:quercetin dioxygenase-like cupin family protein
MRPSSFQSSTEWPEIEALPGVHRRVLSCGGGVMVVQFRIDDGAEVPVHAHPHEQVGHVVAGRLRFRIGDEERELSSGDGYAIPGGMPHGCVAIGATVAVDSFAPVREDYR